MGVVTSSSSHHAEVVCWLSLQLTQWSCLEKLHCLVLQTAAVTSTLVLVFYWAFVIDSTQDVLPDDYLQHAASAPIMLLDVWFSKVPFVSYHLQVIVPASACDFGAGTCLRILACPMRLMYQAVHVWHAHLSQHKHFTGLYDSTTKALRPLCWVPLPLHQLMLTSLVNTEDDMH